jgi:3-phenylpropionate/cinnamic acid dioxygenase small subunit
MMKSDVAWLAGSNAVQSGDNIFRLDGLGGAIPRGLSSIRQATAAMHSEISAEYRSEILELISRYAYTFDEDRLSDYVALFLDDAELSFYNTGSDTPTVTTSSNQERLSVMQDIRSGPINQPGQPRHTQTNTILTAIAPGRVAGRTMLTCTQQPYDASPCRLLFTGVYEDVFQQTDQGWRFAERKLFLDSALSVLD